MWRGMNVSFRDMLFLLVFAYLVIGAIALAHVAKTDEQQSKGQTPPGSVIVEKVFPSLMKSLMATPRTARRWAVFSISSRTELVCLKAPR